MDLQRLAGGFLAVLGATLIAVWAMLFAMGQVPEVQTAPISLAFLVVAEMTTAVLSIVGGAGLVARKAWAVRAYPVAGGMMVYSITNYLGVLAETGPVPVVGLFIGFLALTIYFLLETPSRRRDAGAAGTMSAGSAP